ncbi:SAR2788 family putative toxin [Virgibacillus dokdonensis]|uniref:MafB-related protein n=1 Tax=Virgibacillus dokdonensis TaxID=302167 RepID=A0A2K9J7M1_9BACI|nr:SAR2788 family putative toxin [Virgibacillus dokdonensis]AUJ26531.1 hypothetical protein A21D_03497 [Virgibacillus dokdonensis]
MKKSLIKIIIFTLLFSSLPIKILAEESSIENNNVSATKIDQQDIVEIAHELNVENSSNLEMQSLESDNDTSITTNLDNSDLEAFVEINFNHKSEELTVNSKFELEPGKEEIKNYNLFVHDVNGDDILATLIDQETGDVYNIDSTEIHASIAPAIPVLVAFLGKFGIKWLMKKFGKKAIKSAVKDLNKQLKKKSLGKGSTGRTKARNLEEQIAMKSVLSNPLKGARQVVPASKMKDKRWPGKKGWVKMQRIIEVDRGRKKINIHFNYNKKTKKFDDFKFKN